MDEAEGKQHAAYQSLDVYQQSISPSGDPPGKYHIVLSGHLSILMLLYHLMV